jgi:hypothetical protein
LGRQAIRDCTLRGTKFFPIIYTETIAVGDIEGKKEFYRKELRSLSPEQGVGSSMDTGTILARADTAELAQ